MSKNKHHGKKHTASHPNQISDQTIKILSKKMRQPSLIPQSKNINRDQWRIYWQAQNQLWRTEPAIDAKRQEELSRYLAILPQIEKGIYPFKDVQLKRADVEWLLATHENGLGPVDFSNESQRKRIGLDLRGANLSGIDLSGLPLASLCAGLRSNEWISVKEFDEIDHTAQAHSSTANMEGVNLSRACLEEAILSRVHLENAILDEAHLREANLSEAHLEGASLNRAYLKEANLSEAHLEGTLFSRAHMEKTYLFAAHFENAFLSEAHMEETVLRRAHLERAILFGANLKAADLRAAHLEGANLSEAHLEGANLYGANLRRAIFGSGSESGPLEGTGSSVAHLEGANLYAVNLEEANLSHTHLEGANLSHAFLNGANLYRAFMGGKCFSINDLARVQRWKSDFPNRLPPTDLRGTVFNSKTNLEGVVLGDKNCGFVSIVDVYWGDVNLAVVDWRQVIMLGDEREARQLQKADGGVKDKNQQIEGYREAVRANRQLAAVLRNQGLNEEASYFAYHAQVLQMEVLRKQIKIAQKLMDFIALVQRTGAWVLLAWLWYWLCRLGNWAQKMKVWVLLSKLGHWLLKLGGYIFSLLLYMIAGYGYKPMRSLFTYLLTIFGFATLYYIFGQEVKPHLSPLAALVLSMTSFHGRGFFPGENVSLDNPLTVLAALEAAIGLVIEISFIAAFTQRFFGK